MPRAACLWVLLLVSVGLLAKTLGYLDSRDVAVILLWVAFAAILAPTARVLWLDAAQT